MRSITTRISRLEESRPTNATAYIWLGQGESQDAALARYCAKRGIEYLAPGVDPVFLIWNWADCEGN
jgi:hypothetical protein